MSKLNYTISVKISTIYCYLLIAIINYVKLHLDII